MATVETPQITETDVQNTVTDKAKKLGVTSLLHHPRP